MDVALSSHYQVIFSGFPNALSSYLNGRGIDAQMINKIGMMCYDASLPGSSLATTNIEGSFQGVQQEYAHTRQFVNISMGFYCDSNYRVLDFFESWMNWISGGGATVSPSSPNYFYRMRYPDQYKCYPSIAKFDRNYASAIQYNFVRMFPKSISATPISYEQSQILRINVDFNYERYFTGTTVNVNGNVTNNGSFLNPAVNAAIRSGLNDQDLVELNSYRDLFTKSGSGTTPAGLDSIFGNTSAFKEFQNKLTNQNIVDDFINFKQSWASDSSLTSNDFVNFTNNVSFGAGSAIPIQVVPFSSGGGSNSNNSGGNAQ